MSGLTINEALDETPGDFLITKQRLWLTAERDRLVVEGDPESAFFFASAGARVSRGEAERYGLIDGAAESSEKEPAGDKPAGEKATTPTRRSSRAKKED